MINIEGNLAVVNFNKFDLDTYKLFLKTKKLPEHQIAYDWKTDTYRLTTPARFAPMLGAAAPDLLASSLPIASHLFDYQQFIDKQALEAKRYAIWADTGLGKTAMFLEYGRQVKSRTGGRVLILSPLQIIEQTREEATKFYGNELPIERINTRGELIDWCKDPSPAIGITNYDKLRDGIINEFRHLGGLIADESSILKTGGGVIKWNLIKSSRGVEYKLNCTATPAPNDTMEYASQAAQLEKLKTEADILWTYFTKTKRGDWVVKPHAREAFYRFMASWSIYLRNPAHFGWKDILATLPPPEITEYRLDSTDEQRAISFGLFVENGSGLFGHERMGIKERIKLSQIAKGFMYEGKGGARTIRYINSRKPRFVCDLIEKHRNADRQVIVWTTFDEESEILARLLGDDPHVGYLDGSMATEARYETINSFKRGEIAILITKPQLVGYGLNFQNCRAMVFCGFDDSFERMYQAIRRAYRYGQTEKVYVDVPYIPELEAMIFNNIKRKQELFDRDTAIQEKYYKEALGEFRRAAGV